MPRSSRSAFYWVGKDDRELYFASELRSLLAGLPTKPELNEDALQEYFCNSYITSPATILKGVMKVPPGNFLKFNTETEFLATRQQRYWNLPTTNRKFDDDSAKASLNEVLRKAVKQQLVADVPVGAFLSGGVDSSTIVSIAQSQLTVPLKTFTIGFEEDKFNEAKQARKIAEYLGTDHKELYLSVKEIAEELPNIVKTFDEPCGDVSLIPTRLLASFARKEVKVVLSGDGGDELFWGYARYKKALAYNKKLQGLRSITWHGNRFLGKTHAGNKFKKGLGILCSASLHDLYLKQNSHWLFPANSELTDTDHPDVLARSDFSTYLPDDVLFKVDRATMAAGLEGRVPLLGREVIEFAFSLPFEFKYKGGNQKYLLREILNDYLPRSKCESPKKGFNLPLGKWLREDLSDWARDVVRNSKLKDYDLIPHNKAINMLEDHIKGRSENTYLLWDYLVMSLWLDEYY